MTTPKAPARGTAAHTLRPFALTGLMLIACGTAPAERTSSNGAGGTLGGSQSGGMGGLGATTAGGGAGLSGAGGAPVGGSVGLAGAGGDAPAGAGGSVAGSAGSGGGVAGVGGTGGSGVQLVEPVDRGDTFVLEFGDTFFEVSPANGGRIISFRRGGENLLMPLEEVISPDGDWLNGGSTFWTSPQADWSWPPVAALDRDPYAASVDSTDSAIVLQSGPISIAGASLSVTKRFTADLVGDAIDLAYTMTVESGSLSLAGWEISRVPATGISFFAGQNVTALGGLPEPAMTTSANGVVWLDHALQTAEAKLGADATGGYIAYATPTLLFVKTMPDVALGQAAPGEAEIEWYVKNGLYVEIEQQGALAALAAGQSATYSLRWYVRQMDSKVVVAPESDSLLSFTQSVIGTP